MKKFAAIMLCAALLFPVFSIKAGESANMASGDYEYALNKDGTAIITKYNGSEAAVAIPDVLDRHAVVEVGPRAFQENESLVSLVIPEGIKAINVEAFAMCRNLVSVSLPESLTDIGNAAFYGCENLGAVHLPAKVASIAEQAFNACTSLENFTVSRDSQSFTVNEGVLFDKGGQLLVDYPSGKPGTAYLIPEGTRGISPYAFMGNNSLLSLTLPQSMTEIGDRSFYGINSVKSINIPNKVIKIGDSAFSECDSLATFSLPASVNEIGVSIFYRCDALEQILVDEGSAAFSSRDGVLYDKGMTIVHAYPCAKKDEAFEIPAGVTAVADYAFYDASFLKKATVPLGVQTIGWGAFQSCRTLEEAIILDSMTSIGRNAFIQCDKLTLHVWEGSYAHQYAVENPVPYAFLTEYPQSSALDDAQATLPQTAEMTPAPVSDCEYTLNEDGTAVITKYNGSEAEVTLPDTLDGYAVTAIGKEAFMNNAELVGITIPEGVRTIGEWAFGSCRQLTEIRLPASLEALGERAFRSCESLVSFAIPSGLIEIGTGAFDYCTSLSGFTVSAGNPSYQAMDGVLFDTRSNTLVCYPCAKPGTDYSIPEGTKNIAPNAFNYALNLTRITLPSSMTEIGEYAFYNAENLAIIEIPDWTAKIGGYAFYGCRSLREINIPKGVTDIGRFVFGGCDSLTDIHVSPNNTAYTSLDGILLDKAMTTILACPGGMSNERMAFPAGVSVIGDGAFGHCHLLVDIEIPSGIASIGGFAFDGCSNLERITLPDSIQTIGQCAFRYCYQLMDIRLPAALKEIEFGLFDSCKGLESIELPEGLTAIQQSAFEDCTSLRELVIPDGVSEIGYAAFKGCAGLTSLWIPQSVSIIEEKAFESCDNLTLQVSDGSYAQLYATENGIPYAFVTGSPPTAVPAEAQMTPALTGDYEYTVTAEGEAVITRYLGSAVRLDIPGQLGGYPVSGIGAYSFNECASLEYAGIPDGVRSIGEHAFSSCGNLVEIRLPGTLTDIGDWAFSLDEKLAEITIPGNVTRIGQGAFHWCRALQNVMIPPGVVEIGVTAFAGCAMKSVDIPEGVIRLGDYAFSSNASLSGVSLPTGVTEIGSGAFAYSPNLSIITVAQGNAYYETIQGVLFDKTLRMLHTYPAGITGTAYEIPQGTTRIGVLAFGSTSSLQTVVIPDSVWEIRSHAFFSSGITNLKIPPLVTRIESSLFASCFNLETVSIHPGVEYIGESAFDSCDRLTLEVEEGSFAQQYAAENNIPYSLTSGAVASEATQTTVLIPQSTPAIHMDILPGPTNPIIEYIQEQDQDPNAIAFFNISYYAQKNPDLVAASGGDEELMRVHWLNYGIHEGRKGSPSFDAKWYLANYPDLEAAFGTDYAQAALHYRSIGVAQGRTGSAEFDPDNYAALNPDLAVLYGNDLRALAQHYNDRGFAEGRLAYIKVDATAAPQVETAAEQQPAETQEPEASADASEPAPLNPWPVVQNTLHKLKTIDRGAQRAMAYRGPGKNYREANAFITSKMTRVNGLFIEGKYILTEMNYASVGKRRLYFMIGTFTKTGNTPVWDMEGFGAYAAADAYPRYGPGEDYNDFGGEVLPAGSPVSVFFEENGWVFMEFMSPQGLDRGWVPAEFVVSAGM